MHFLGARGFPRRYADPYRFEEFQDLLPLNQFITLCAFLMGAAQLVFLINFFGSLIWGPKADRNPWHANTVEWSAPSPPPHGNFDVQPRVYRGPYEYSHPNRNVDYWPQTEPPPTAAPESDTEPVGGKTS
jgi:cytochrome c oxidase subunit 1